MRSYLMLLFFLTVTVQAKAMDESKQTKPGFPQSDRPKLPKPPADSAIGIAQTPKKPVTAPAAVDAEAARVKTPAQVQLNILCAEITRKEEKNKKKKEHPECVQ